MKNQPTITSQTLDYNKKTRDANTKSKEVF